MSRSRRKNKIRAITTADSEKQDKRDANRRFRRVVNQKVKQGKTELPLVRELSDVWGFEKDGKIYDAEMTERDMRK
mgnify:CR=1 FL=1